MDAYNQVIAEYLEECDREQIRKDGENAKIFHNDIKHSFRANLDSLHINFIDKFEKEHNKRLGFPETVVIREFTEYLKQNV